MKNLRSIYVKLLDEGTECWRPVEARCVGNKTYFINDTNEIKNAETWEFHCGDKVMCEWHTFSNGERGFVASRKIED